LNGSNIEPQNQILGESIGITGTPFSLNYSSDRVSGRSDYATVAIPLSGASVPTSLKRIDLEIQVAGRMFTQSFSNAPNQTYTFTWDGKDAFGRLVQGMQPVKISTGYVYPAVYEQPAAIAASFAAVSGLPLSGNKARQEITVWEYEKQEIGSPLDARTQGLGGWTINAENSYDPSGMVLSLGNGERRTNQNINGAITTVAGAPLPLGVSPPNSGDGGPATQAILQPINVAAGPDNSLYIVDGLNQSIRRVSPNGIINTVAGGNGLGFSGDGGPATQATLNNPEAVAVGPDGSLYILDTGNLRIRRVGPDGVITTVAGNGTRGLGGDGGPATQAPV
jgi:hypothetical protein